jgi:hypothetical protein
MAIRHGGILGKRVSTDLHPAAIRASAADALRPILGSPQVGVFRPPALRPIFGSPEAGVSGFLTMAGWLRQRSSAA